MSVRKAIHVDACIELHSLSAPGVWLERPEDLCVIFCLLGQKRRTCLLPPVFPVQIFERIKFDKTYTGAIDPGQLSRHLAEEHLLIEVVQFNSAVGRAEVLANYEADALEFLYPSPKVNDRLSDSKPPVREILLNRTVKMPGISPKLAFKSSTVVTDVPLGGDGEDSMVDRKYFSLSRQSSSKGAASLMPGGNLIPTTPLQQQQQLQQPPPQRRRSQQSEQPWDYSVEDPKPPFVVRRCSKTITGRKPTNYGADSTHPRSHARAPPSRRQKRRSKSPGPGGGGGAGPFPVYGVLGGGGGGGGGEWNREDGVGANLTCPKTGSADCRCDNVAEYCPNCLDPHSDFNCTVCQVYKRYTGRPYWGHNFHPDRGEKSRHCDHTKNTRRYTTPPNMTVSASGERTARQLFHDSRIDDDDEVYPRTSSPVFGEGEAEKEAELSRPPSQHQQQEQQQNPPSQPQQDDSFVNFVQRSARSDCGSEDGGCSGGGCGGGGGGVEASKCHIPQLDFTFRKSLVERFAPESQGGKSKAQRIHKKVKSVLEKTQSDSALAEGCGRNSANNLSRTFSKGVSIADTV